MSITFDEAYSNGLISQKVLKMVPKQCMCGSVLTFSDSLRELKCIEPNCKGKILNRITEFCEYNKLPLSYDSILAITEKLGIVSPYQLLMLKDAYAVKSITRVDVPNILSVIKSIESIRATEIKLYQILEMCGINSIRLIARKIAKGFNTTEELFNEIENGQLAFINERLGINNLDSCILSIDVYNTLLNLKEELIFAESLMTIQYNTDRLFIAFNDNVEPFVNKSELIEYLNYKYKKEFVHTTLINDRTDVLIMHIETVTSKYRTARLLNDEVTAKQVNTGELKLTDAGKIIDTDLKPLGQKIYIVSLSTFLERLDKLWGN